ncbi:MAG: bL28 family ribosomal protein [Alphaproteobacteria bacterium]|nr:bL28 family ribosomal protein [Alphaproteobacteria bacterium]
MAQKVCPITKKSSIMGGSYSNRIRATKFNPSYKRGKLRKYANLQKKSLYIPELKKHITVTVSTRGIKTMKKNGVYATLKKAKVI